MAFQECRVKVRLKDVVLNRRSEKKPQWEDRTRLETVLAKHRINYQRLIFVRDGLVIVTPTQEEAAKCMHSQTSKDLQEKDLEVVPPRDLLAKQSLVLKKADETVFRHENDEIVKEIEEQALYTKGKVIEVYKMPQHAILKLKFSELEIAKRVQRDGIKLFGCSYPPWQLESERYTQLRQCMNCYSYQHITQQCDSKDPICSECSGKHYWKECNDKQIRKCTQCGGPHRTFSALCKVRKQALNREMERQTLQQEEKDNKSYSNILKHNTKQAVEATKAVIQKSAKGTEEAIRDMIQAAVKKEIETLQSTMKITIQGAIVEELAYYTTSIKDEIKELREEIRRGFGGKKLPVVKLPKRRITEIIQESHDEISEKEEEFKKPKNPAKTRKTVKKNISTRTKTGSRYEVLSTDDEGDTSNTETYQDASNMNNRQMESKEKEGEDMEGEITREESPYRLVWEDFDGQNQPSIEVMESVEEDSSKGRPSLSPLIDVEPQTPTTVRTITEEAIILSQQQEEVRRLRTELDQERIRELEEELERIKEERCREKEEIKREKERRKEIGKEIEKEETDSEDEEKIRRNVLERIKQVGLLQVHLEIFEERGRIAGEKCERRTHETERNTRIYNKRSNVVVNELKKLEDQMKEEIKRLPRGEREKKRQEFNREMEIQQEECNRIEEVTRELTQKRIRAEMERQEEEEAFSC